MLIQYEKNSYVFNFEKLNTLQKDIELEKRSVYIKLIEYNHFFFNSWVHGQYLGSRARGTHIILNELLS